MSTFRRLTSVVPLVFLFSLLVIHVTAQPRNTNIEVEAGDDHTCGIRWNRTLQCWGNNYYGQNNVPSDVGTVKALSAGSGHTCAIKSDDTLRCWGWNIVGQSDVPPDLGTVKAVSAGDYHTCAIKTDDTLACWGDNYYEQSTIPPDLGTVKVVNGGEGHTCAIKSDDTLRCWGQNSEGQTTIETNLGTVKAMWAGDFHTCAIKSDDTLRCWGLNITGQSDVPPDLGMVKAVSGGTFHTCAIKTDDTLRCWGGNTQGQIDLPPDLGTVRTVRAGGSHTCAVKTDDTLRCWGANGSDQSTPPLPLISMSLSSLVLVEGNSVTVKINASDYPWTNVIVSLNYTGTATRTSDYNAVASIFMTTSDNFADLVITTTDDTELEPDETIILDITTVTDGTENGTQQVILVIQDNDSITPTVEATSTSQPTPTLDAPSGNLLVNAGFEAGVAPWVVKTGVGDKVKCNKDGKPPVAKSGTCAFQFKSGAGEKTKIEQTLPIQSWAVGDALILSVFVKATNAAATGRVKVSIKYSDGTAAGKINADIVQTSDYTELIGSYALLSANVSKVKLSIQNRSAAGKVLVDDVLLLKGGVVRLLALP
jgi:alpha-tubulin suppressor-like RCC1 family protein